jgi:phage terminase small subunit
MAHPRNKPSEEYSARRLGRYDANKALTGSEVLAVSLHAGVPLKPAGLSGRASAEWDRLLKELEDAGLQITVAHRAPLTLAATIAADIASDWEEIQKEGAYSLSPKGGIQAHPAVKRMDALRRDYMKALSLLGLRAAVSGEKPGDDHDLDAVLNG